MMKKRTPLKLLYMAIAMFATALLGLPAGLAADAKKPQNKPGVSAAQKPVVASRVEQIFNRFDKDKDGKLSKAEMKTYLETNARQNKQKSGLSRLNPERQKQVLKRFDKDGDGKLSNAEQAAWDKSRRENRARYIKRWDTDKDGKLSKAEQAAARKQNRQQRQKLLERWDKNGDGKLSDAERELMKKAPPQAPPQAK